MELRHLRYFIAVAEERNFSRAAVRLNIAQPPLSQQIRRLERDLGFDLFIRTPKGVVPTRAGEVLLKHARIVLESSAVAIAAAEAAQRGVVGRLTIAFFNSAAYTILPKLLKAYRAAQPGVEVEVREMVIADQIDALIEGHIDVGILRPPVMDTRVDMLRLTREPFVVALPADHKLAAKRRLSLADVSNQRLVSYPYGHLTGFRERTDAAFVAAGITATTLYEATQIHTICGLVASGAAMAIVPASARVLRMEGLRFVPLSGSGLVAETWLGWRKQNSIVQLKSFVDVAQSLIDRP
ncbi:LysR family transcriptional regulator [Paralcaligenes ureilyticus]|uniref:DNA-binding transcriptional LysR family regulator n=1 Tax=Paralcaligenes ureilyticus TaxID=627131 RepID=A0A4R3LZV5_9BURK|nr:LysR family transcriptional regulator [Paralcaligenes ureilyticus]TCT06314.1 DNA-binding transcriptional LysR family regulator [Paralcaligenes ureilyticus]